MALVGRQQSLAFLIGAGIALIACLVLVLGHPHDVMPERDDNGSPFRYLKLVPVALAAAALNAGLETAGLSLLPVYAINLGWLGDHMSRPVLIIFLASFSACGASI